MKGAEKSYVGRWRIVQMESWDTEYVDMEVAAHITIRKNLTGEFQFGLVQGQLDGQLTGSGKSVRCEFSWSGFDENDAVSGRGWLRVSGDHAEGWLQVHLGEESTLLARRQ